MDSRLEMWKSTGLLDNCETPVQELELSQELDSAAHYMVTTPDINDEAIYLIPAVVRLYNECYIRKISLPLLIKCINSEKFQEQLKTRGSLGSVGYNIDEVVIVKMLIRLYMDELHRIYEETQITT